MAENGNTEKIELEQIEAEQMPEVYDSQIAACIDEYCKLTKPPISDMKKEGQNIWNGALMYTNRCLFKDRDILKDKRNIEIPGAVQKSNLNRYDISKVDKVLESYAYLCVVNDKEISRAGFSFLTGIPLDTLNDWATRAARLSNASFHFVKKIDALREESLSAKLSTAGNKAMGILAILNHQFKWNLPGVSKETAQRAALGAADLPKLGESAPVQVLESEGKQDVVVAEKRTTIY